jgi:hypothetical protein
MVEPRATAERGASTASRIEEYRVAIRARFAFRLRGRSGATARAAVMRGMVHASVGRRHRHVRPTIPRSGSITGIDRRCRVQDRSLIAGSNYTHLSNRDGAVLEPTNPCPNELTYAKMLAGTLAMYGFKDHGFIIDTSRNGKGNIRTKWGDWCNVRGAGLGEHPRANPAPGIDAYWWVRPPGESDGSSDPNGLRFDVMCAGPNAAKNAPQAGKWFEAYFMDLVHNANPAL